MANEDKAVSEEKQTPKAASEEQQPKETDAAATQEQKAEGSETEAEVKPSKKEKKLIDKLQQELEQTKKKADENWNEFVRARAELDNTQKRMQRDVENAHKFAVEKFILEVLPVKDTLEMGLAAAKEQSGSVEKLVEGTELTLKMFTDAVTKFGVEVVDPIDQSFNPEFHQAMSIQPTNAKPPNTVLAVMQKGYTLNGRLLRPAMVVVSKEASNEEQKSESPPLEEGAEKVGTNIDEQA